jgi:hypothetical protein
MAFAFRAVCAIFLSKNLESLAGDAPVLIAPGRKPMAAGHKPLIETFERASCLEVARP